MGILKTGLKLVGSVALGAVGLASTVVRTCASGAGMDGVAEVVGSIQDKSFDTIQDMWTPDEKKNDEYYERRCEKSEQRRESAQRNGQRQREKIERAREEMKNK